MVEELFRLWPDATIFANLIDRQAVPPSLRDADLRPGLAQRAYRGGRGYAYLLPALPLSTRRHDLRGFDLVLTSHSAFANRVRAVGRVPIVSYVHTPARWIWQSDMRTYEAGRAGAALLGAFAATQRRPDRGAAGRLAAIVANSTHVADRVRRWWQQPATVIPPPVDVARHTAVAPVARGDFFLLAGRLVPYKRPELAVAAARRAGVRLVVAGDGRSRVNVERHAGPGIELLGRVDDRTLTSLYQTCRALLFPGEEDFGMVPVEAQAAGAPVIAYGVGGVRDSVIDGVTGILYDVERPGQEEQHVQALAAAIDRFDPGGFDPGAISVHAQQFSPAAFRARFAALVQSVTGIAPTDAVPG